MIVRELELDLVEVADKASPPVCRIMDYGKFKYEQSKREKESRKGAKHSELREVRMRVKIDVPEKLTAEQEELIRQFASSAAMRLYASRNGMPSFTTSALACSAA